MSKRNGSDVRISPPQNSIPPDAPCCLNCGHSVVAQLPPPNITKIRVCKLLPPTPIATRAANNVITGVVAASPTVADNDFCSHFEKRQDQPAEESQAANSESVIAGG